MATIAAREPSAPQALTAASWRALVASFLGWMFDGYETYALILVAAVALRQLLAPDQLASLPIYIGGLLAVTLIGWATGGIIAGILADYIGRKRMLMLSILWYALFTGLTAFAGSYASLLILRFLTGLGLGAEWGPGTAILGESWPAKSRGRAASVLQSAIGFGLLIASGVWLFVSPLGPAAWRYMFLIGVLPALSVLWIRTSVRDPEVWLAAHERRRLARQRVASGRPVSPEDRALVGFTVKRILAAPDLRRRLLLLLLLSLGQFAWMPASLPELFPTAVRGSAISLVFDVTRYLAAAGPLLAGWLIVSLGGVSAAASIIGLAYILGLVVTPFAAPETKGHPLPA